MTSLADTRAELVAALEAGITDTDVRVTATPVRPGNLTRTKALVTVGQLTRIGDELGHIAAAIEIQVGLGPGIDYAYNAMDDLLEQVDDALPINFELAAWALDDLQDDQPVLVAVADVAGWAVAAGSELTWDEATTTWDDTLVTWNGAT